MMLVIEFDMMLVIEFDMKFVTLAMTFGAGHSLSCMNSFQFGSLETLGSGKESNRLCTVDNLPDRVVCRAAK
jgi:hypothetical protein